MSKYTSKDADVKALDAFDRANYEYYLLNYHVDANIETAKGADAISNIINVLKGGPFKFDFNDPKGMYIMIYALLIGVSIILIVILLIFFIIVFVYWLIKKKDTAKLYWKLSGLLLIFIIGMFLLVLILSKLNDRVNTIREKIVFKL